MKIYYSHLFNGVNQHYQDSLANDPDLRITIKLKNFLFFTNQTEWTNQYRNGIPGYAMHKGREVLKAGAVLDSFRNFMNENKFPFTYDMAIATFK